MESPEFYRHRAEELRAKAAGLNAPVLKEQFAKLACEYESLAAQIEGFGSSRDKWRRVPNEPA
jgi:hypothetical protein